MHDRACPICQQDDSRVVGSVVTTAAYEVRRCRQCRLVFTTPRPTPEQLEAFYTSTYFRRQQDAPVGYVNYRGAGELNARKMWHVFNRDVYQVHHADRLLDVGCATGGFLAEAARCGFVNGRGVELSEEAVRIACDEFKLDVLHGDINHRDLLPRSFDVLTLWHVVEHCPDPLAVLRRACDLLSPGGRVFLELPSWNSAGRIVRRSAWSQLKPPEHINFFTTRTLAGVARLAGLVVVRCWSVYPGPEPDPGEAARSTPLDGRVRQWVKSGAAIAGWGGYVRLLARRSTTAP